MLPIKRFKLPHQHGGFGVPRKHDVHTGIDLYCNPGSHVFAIEEGIVTRIGEFTGEFADSPWWNNTKYLIIKGKSGYILYGEIINTYSVINFPTVGLKVKEGDLIGEVATVLKENKGKPMTMLHLELYDADIEPVIWALDQPKPINLLDPLPLLNKELWKFYDKNHKSHELIELPEGEWFNISGRGLVMTLDLRKLDASIRVNVADNVKIAGKLYHVSGIEYPSRQTAFAGLLLREIEEVDE